MKKSYGFNDVVKKPGILKSTAEERTFRWKINESKDKITAIKRRIRQ